ncbi:hypothetical protein [Dyadobacter jiangsuensis]|uniref:Uncharacterized protein n=1 Tax=Dyadobacter jiangsuensis TaxID=1591085 RepID=A0A2P8GIQ4_9BACT|nr:hypothetical protein [Dyadobacter jiangsuensis]PSL33852.1 hypothetical protein CLV60_101221 [Dyadobacter jiangsuensis]
MRLLFFVLFLCIFRISNAQDSIRVTFAEEESRETFVKQRFVDRYENVFMTKVPTRHMLKLGLTFKPNYIFSIENTANNTTQVDVGYEYKLLPSWSVGADVGVSGGWGDNAGLEGLVSGKIYGRWYYDMRRRIREGTGSNNFTGNFLAVVGERQWGKEIVNNRLKRIGLEFGLQRRFLNRGRMELGIGLYYQDYRQDGDPLLLAYEFGKSSRIAIASRTSMGLAFGDWKRQKDQPFCEVLRCDDFVRQLWKLQWPTVYISPDYSNGSIGLAYERKLKSSPFSLNTQVALNYMRIVSRDFPTPGAKLVSNDYQLQSTLHLRYYTHQKKAIRQGTGGNNLSGFYIAPYVHHLFYHSETYFGEGKSKRHLGLGAGVGFQQVMLGSVFIDISAGVSQNLLKIDQNSQRYLGYVRMGFGLVL